MSIKSADIWGNNLTQVIKPAQPLIDSGWGCGPATPEWMNWILYLLSQSALSNVHVWNPISAANQGYGLRAVVLGSNGKFYQIKPGGNSTFNPVIDGGVNWEVKRENLPLRYINGLLWINDLTTPVTDILIGTGAAHGAGRIDAFADATMIKRLTLAWSVGANGGLCGTGVALAANTDYSLHAIINPATGQVDYGVDTAANAGIATNLVGVGGAALASGYTVAVHIGWVQTDGASAIVLITRHGEFVRYRSNSVVDALNPVDNTNITSRSPPNTLALVQLSGELAAAANNNIFIKLGIVGEILAVASVTNNDLHASSTFSGGGATVQTWIPVNSSKQYLQRFVVASGTPNRRHFTNGYIFNRVRS